MSLTSESRRACIKKIALFTAFVFSAGIASGAEWKVETVDQSGAGRFTSMQVDTNGNVHVVYIPESDTHPVRYAFWDHKLDRWFTMTIAKYASFCTMVLDSKQRPHISYATHGTGKGAKLHYLHWVGDANWEDKTISPTGDGVVAYYTSIALDANDVPSFSYYDYEGPAGVGFMLRMRSVFWNGQYWEVRMVDRGSGSGKFNSIAIDSKGHKMLAYANVKAETSGLRFADWDGENWNTEILEGQRGAQAIYSVAMIVDKNDNPHIAYSDVVAGYIKHATRRNGKWEIEIVDRVNRVGYPDRNGIAMDENGNLYISYFDSGDGVLKVASTRNGKWYGEVVARDFAGFTSSVQARNGMLWVSFADDATGTFKVARRPIDTSAPVPVPVVPTPPAKAVSK